MESAISSLILFSVGIYAALTIAHTYLESQDLLWGSEQARQEQALERAQTALSIHNVETQAGGAVVALTVRNNGQVKLSDFERWDVIVEYYSEPEFWVEPEPYDFNIARLPYVDTAPEPLQWTVNGIYVDAQALRVEAFDPGILNPDEEMVIEARLSPSVALTTTNRIVVSTPNGISAAAHFLR